MLSNDEPFNSFGKIYIVGEFYPMRMTVIFVNGPSDGALLNIAPLWILKYIYNMPSFFKDPHKIFLEMRHGNRIAIINANRKSIGIKLLLARISTGVCCTVLTSDVV